MHTPQQAVVHNYPLKRRPRLEIPNQTQQLAAIKVFGAWMVMANNGVMSVDLWFMVYGLMVSGTESVFPSAYPSLIINFDT